MPSKAWSKNLLNSKVQVVLIMSPLTNYSRALQHVVHVHAHVHAHVPKHYVSPAPSHLRSWCDSVSTSVFVFPSRPTCGDDSGLYRVR